MKRTYFGTDGVRGPYGGPLINEAFASRLGQAVGQWLGSGGRVLIGRDTRASGIALAGAVASGLRTAGFETVSLGVLPTPAVALAVRESDAVLGVVITASHNPSGDNGIKFFNTDGAKFTDAQEFEIETILETLSPAESNRAVLVEDGGAALERYLAVMSQQMPNQALAGWRIVLDTAHGATAFTSPQVLRELGADVVGLGDQPDGTNINAGVGSEHPKMLSARVVEEGARLGIAHDGDGDRCIFCDENGDVVDGDEILTLLAVDALRRNELGAGTLVVTVQSNLGVDRAVAQAGGRVMRTEVGDRYVSEGMRAAGANLGGESSGHIICADLGPSGDGLGAALRVLRSMHASGEPLSSLRRVLSKFPQRSGALRVSEKRPLAQCIQLSATMKKMEEQLGREGRLLVRYSGTEPKLRLLVEGPTDEIVTSAYERLEKAARIDLGS